MKREECLDIVNKMIADGIITQDDAAKYFPELAESRDEKIRKALMQNLKERFGTKGSIGKGLDMPDVLDWFEKQGEKTSDRIVEKAKTEKQRVLLTETNGAANIDWDTRSIQDVKLLLEYGLDYINRLEKQGKQKSDDKVEQKPAWNEDIETAISIIKHIAGEQEIDNCPHNANNLRKAAKYLETYRYQSTWKPSAAQIDALRFYIEKDFINKEGCFGKCIVKLYEQLKKLIEN